MDRSRERIFFFQAENSIRDIGVTGVQTCALPISGEVVGELGGAASPHDATRVPRGQVGDRPPGAEDHVVGVPLRGGGAAAVRSEERRVGKECSSRWSPYH